jgi:hypothetical protein
VGSGGVDLSYKGKINIAFRYTGSGKNLALDGLSGDDVQVLGSKLLKIRILFFFDAVLPQSW